MNDSEEVEVDWDDISDQTHLRERAKGVVVNGPRRVSWRRFAFPFEFIVCFLLIFRAEISTAG